MTGRRLAFGALVLAATALPAALVYRHLGGFVNADITHMHYPPWAEMQRTWRDREIPLWTPHWISGYPLVASAESRIYEPLSFLLLPLGGEEAWRHRVLVGTYYLLAGLAAFLYLRRIGLGGAAALLGALLFEFGVQTPTGVSPLPLGFRYFIAGWFYLPLLWWGIERLLAPAGKRGRDLGLLGLVYGAALLSVNPQFMLYLTVAAAGYQLLRGGGERPLGVPLWKPAATTAVLGLALARFWTPAAWAFLLAGGWLLAASLVAALGAGAWRGAWGAWRSWLWLPLGWALASPQLVFDVPFTLDSPRLHAPVHWSQYVGLEALASIPDFARFLSRENAPEMSLSVGFAAFLLAGTALWRGPGRARPALALAAFALVWLGLSRTVFIGSMDQGRLRPLFDLGVAVMAATGFQALLVSGGRWAWAALGGAAAALALNGRDFGSLARRLLETSESWPSPEAWTLGACLAAGAAYALFACRRRWGLELALAPLWAVAVLHSLWPPLIPPRTQFHPLTASPLEYPVMPVVAALKAQPGVFRMHGERRGGEQPISVMASVSMAAGLEPLSGGDPLYVRRFGELFSNNLYMGWEAPLVPDLLPLFSLMNVRFVILPHGQPALFEPFQKVFENPWGDIYRNPNALPRAFLVGGAEQVEPRAGILRMRRADFNPLSAVLLEAPDPVGPLPPGPVSGQAEVSMPTRRSARILVESDREAYLVWSMVHCPGWQARIDGRPVPVLVAYHALQAVRVPAGRHLVTFLYLPARVPVSAAIALAALAAVLALLLKRD